MSIIVPSIQGIKGTDRNTELPFFPSLGYYVVQSNVTAVTAATLLPQPFMWLEAYYNYSVFTGFPVLAVWTGGFTAANVPYVTPVQFAYPGQPKHIKGIAIVTSGVDLNGNTITSTVIGATEATQIQQVIAYGGMV